MMTMPVADEACSDKYCWTRLEASPHSCLFFSSLFMFHNIQLYSSQPSLLFSSGMHWKLHIFQVSTFYFSFKGSELEGSLFVFQTRTTSHTTQTAWMHSYPVNNINRLTSTSLKWFFSTWLMISLITIFFLVFFLF